MFTREVRSARRSCNSRLHSRSQSSRKRRRRHLRIIAAVGHVWEDRERSAHVRWQWRDQSLWIKWRRFDLAHRLLVVDVIFDHAVGQLDELVCVSHQAAQQACVVALVFELFQLMNEVEPRL